MPLRLITLVCALVIAVVAYPSNVALAQPAECADVWDDLAGWSARVERGVDTQILEELKDLTARLEVCRPGSTASHDGMGADVEVWRPLVAVYFSGSDIDRVLCLMGHESGGNPNAENPRSGAAGLMQVLPSWADVFGYEVADLFDPAVNLWISAELAEAHGWASWSPYQRGACR